MGCLRITVVVFPVKLTDTVVIRLMHAFVTQQQITTIELKRKGKKNKSLKKKRGEKSCIKGLIEHR